MRLRPRHSLPLLLLALTSCAGQYNITGNTTVPVLDDRMLYLNVSRDGVAQTSLDSCKVVHGRFTFYGDVDTVVMAQICMRGESVMPIVLEEGNLTISVDNMGQRVSGGPLNDCLYKFYRQRNRIDDEMWELQQKAIHMMQQGKPMDYIEQKLGRKMEQLNHRMEALETDFIVSNSHNVLGPGVFMIMCNQYPTPVITDHMRQILERVPQTFFNDPSVERYLRRARYTPCGSNARH